MKEDVRTTWLVGHYKPATIALCALNSVPPTEKTQSVKSESLSRFSKSVARRHSGTLSCIIFDWPEIFTDSWTTLT